YPGNRCGKYPTGLLPSIHTIVGAACRGKVSLRDRDVRGSAVCVAKDSDCEHKIEEGYKMPHRFELLGPREHECRISLNSRSRVWRAGNRPTPRDWIGMSTFSLVRMAVVKHLY